MLVGFFSLVSSYVEEVVPKRSALSWDWCNGSVMVLTSLILISWLSFSGFINRFSLRIRRLISKFGFELEKLQGFEVLCHGRSVFSCILSRDYPLHREWLMFITFYFLNGNY